MKSRGIQRGVKLQRFERAAGDAPTLGRMERMPGMGLRRRRRRKRRNERGRGNRERIQRQRVMLTWSAVLVLVSLVVMAVAVLGGLRRNSDHGSSENRTGVTSPDIGGEVLPEIESLSQLEALNLVKRALAVRDEAEVVKSFRPGSASPGQIVGFLKGLEKVDGAVEDITWLGNLNASGMVIEGVLVKTSMDDRPRNRLALLTPDGSGTWKVDYESFARTVSPSWKELLDGTAVQGVVRVIVAADNYYNGPFRDDLEWECYRMVSPDTEVVMMGYCRRDSAQAKAMNRIIADEDSLARVRKPKRAILRVRRIDGAETRQFEISQVLAEDWVLPATPFDEGFR